MVYGCGVESGVNSTNLNLAFKVGHTDLLLLLRDLVVHVHRNTDVSVPHDFLDDLQVRFMLTQPSAERMPEIMDGEVWQQHRLTMLPLSQFSFLLVVVPHDANQSLVDVGGLADIPSCSHEDEAFISVNLSLAKPGLHLFKPLVQQSFLDLAEHRNHTLTCLSLRSGDVELSMFAIVRLAIDQIVVNGDGILREVTVLPPQTSNLSYSTSSAQKDGKER